MIKYSKAIILLLGLLFSLSGVLLLLLPPSETESFVPSTDSYSDTKLLYGESVNINTADLRQLMRIPGLGEAKAQSLLDYRTEHGEFKTAEELLQVKGIGESLLADILPYIRLEG